LTEKSSGSGADERSAAAATRVKRLEHQLEVVVASRVGEDQVTWTIFSIFWAAQVLLVGVLFQGPQFPPRPVVGLVVSVIGLAMSAAWAITQDRSLMHLERFEDLTKLIEDELQKDGMLAWEYRLTMSMRFRGLRARDVMRVSCWGAVLAWFVSIVIFICHASGTSH
jgi:hypothetical protein